MMAVLSSLTAILVLIGAAIIIARPYWAFLAVVIMFPAEQLMQAYFPYLQTHTSLFNLGVAGLALVAFALRAFRRDPVTSGMNNPVTALIYAQFILWLIAMMYSGEEAPFETSLGQTGRYLIFNLILLPMLIVSLDEFRRILSGIMLAGALLAILILLNPHTDYWAGRLTLDLGMMSREKDQVGNPLATATLGGMVALIATLIVPRSRQPVYTVLRATAFILGYGLAIGSGSRGQVLATAITSILFFPVARRLNSPRNFIFSALGLIIVGAGVYATFQLFIGDQNRERWDPLAMVRDIGMRFDMCWVFLEAWISSPAHWLFGLGTNAWMGIGASSYQADYVHNIAVEILCEHGLVGATIFVATIVLVIRAGINMWRLHRDDPVLRSAAAIFMAIGAFTLFNELKQGNISNGSPFYWWLVMSKISYHEQRVAGFEALPGLEPQDWGFTEDDDGGELALARS